MQKKVNNFNSKNLIIPLLPISRIADILSEVGELSKEVLKATDYGTKDFEVTDDFVLEYGDVLYSLLSMAQECGINPDLALEQTILKYSKRIAKNGTMGSEGD